MTHPHPERMPIQFPDHPISEAEIAKQGYEIDAVDERRKRELAHQAFLELPPEEMQRIADILTTPIPNRKK